MSMTKDERIESLKVKIAEKKVAKNIKSIDERLSTLDAELTSLDQDIREIQSTMVRLQEEAQTLALRSSHMDPSLAGEIRELNERSEVIRAQMLNLEKKHQNLAIEWDPKQDEKIKLEARKVAILQQAEGEAEKSLRIQPPDNTKVNALLQNPPAFTAPASPATPFAVPAAPAAATPNPAIWSVAARPTSTDVSDDIRAFDVKSYSSKHHPTTYKKATTALSNIILGQGSLNSLMSDISGADWPEFLHTRPDFTTVGFAAGERVTDAIKKEAVKKYITLMVRSFLEQEVDNYKLLHKALTQGTDVLDFLFDQGMITNDIRFQCKRVIDAKTLKAEVSPAIEEFAELAYKEKFNALLQKLPNAAITTDLFALHNQSPSWDQLTGSLEKILSTIKDAEKVLAELDVNTFAPLSPANKTAFKAEHDKLVAHLTAQTAHLVAIKGGLEGLHTLAFEALEKYLPKGDLSFEEIEFRREEIETIYKSFKSSYALLEKAGPVSPAVADEHNTGEQTYQRLNASFLIQAMKQYEREIKDLEAKHKTTTDAAEKKKILVQLKNLYKAAEKIHQQAREINVSVFDKPANPADKKAVEMAMDEVRAIHTALKKSFTSESHPVAIEDTKVAYYVGDDEQLVDQAEMLKKSRPNPTAPLVATTGNTKLVGKVVAKGQVLKARLVLPTGETAVWKEPDRVSFKDDIPKDKASKRKIAFKVAELALRDAHRHPHLPIKLHGDKELVQMAYCAIDFLKVGNPALKNIKVEMEAGLGPKKAGFFNSAEEEKAKLSKKMLGDPADVEADFANVRSQLQNAHAMLGNTTETMRLRNQQITAAAATAAAAAAGTTATPTPDPVLQDGVVEGEEIKYTP